MDKEFLKIKKSLENGEYQPIYLFHGDEPYYKNELIKLCKSQILTEEERAFNFQVLKGESTNSSEIVNLASQYPVFAKYRLIIVSQADKLKITDSLLNYFRQTLDSTIVIFHSEKKIDKRGKFYKALLKVGSVFESKKIYEDKMNHWLSTYGSLNEIKIEPKASQYLVELLGNNLESVVSAIDRINNQNGSITADGVLKYIDGNKSYTVFELCKKLGEKQYRSVIKIATSLLSDKNNGDPILLTAMIFGYFQKILIFTQNSTASSDTLLKKLGLSHKFFLSEYKVAAEKYGQLGAYMALSYLKALDFQLKGIHNSAIDNKKSFLQCLVRILNIN